MRIAIAGKGGTGKTTIAGTLARAVARRRDGHDVLAIDADTNPNLASVLGIPERARDIVGLPRTLIERRTTADGTTTTVFAADPEAVLREYAVEGPDKVKLLVMGRVGHGGAGWLCSAHATVRGLLGEIAARGDDQRHIIVDMEAGLEHLSRGTGRHVSRLVAVLEPYYRSMETARNVASLSRELGVADVVVVANKVRDAGDGEAIAAFCRAHDMRLVGEVPYDPALAEAERRGGALIDTAPHSPAVAAIANLADVLMV